MPPDASPDPAGPRFRRSSDARVRAVTKPLDETPLSKLGVAQWVRRAGMKEFERRGRGGLTVLGGGLVCERRCTGFGRARARESGCDGQANGRHVGDDPRRVRSDTLVRAGRLQTTAAAAREDAFVFGCIRVRDACDVRTSSSGSSSVPGVRTAPACAGLPASGIPIGAANGVRGFAIARHADRPITVL